MCRKNTSVVFLPANTTSLMQPCYQGRIGALKSSYSHEMRARILESFEDNEEITANDSAEKTTLLEAVHLFSSSRNRILVDTIRNCFAPVDSVKH
ncbi:hypothetical protein AVEN_50477-1 [Araneus ventricosus]|uniref:DDE-1 domain-containing protein n=1 Tax=Araneus ventricosus TaxID=182803 RepID=A0A4Y2ASC4_ARAVE|nr:hypothetical protein AVEN_50477-1 [Araneus ventricosus]